MSSQPILLIDGKNAAYRAIYANRGGGQNRQHHFVVLLRFISFWINQHRPSSVYVFWDTRREHIWRKGIYSGYKDRVDDDVTGVKEELSNLIKIAMEMFQFMSVRQVRRKGMEADDLIYAACKFFCPQDLIIISSDNDFTQIPFFMPHVKLFEPKQRKFVERPTHNPVIRKALMGDVGDCVEGYAGIGEKKSLLLTESTAARLNFLDGAGHERFHLNLLLVDLGLCPELLINELAIAKTSVAEVQYDRATVQRLAQELKIAGLVSEYEHIVTPFKGLK